MCYGSHVHTLQSLEEATMSVRANPGPRLFRWSLLAILLTPLWASADAFRVIELNDGSQLKGVIIDYANGTYTVQTDTLGRLQLQDAQIRSIHAPARTSPGVERPDPLSANSASPSRLKRLQKQLLARPDTLSQIMSLQQDPDLLAILNDPAIMQAITSGQITTLQANPKIRKLEDNPTIQEILRTFSQ